MRGEDQGEGTEGEGRRWGGGGGYRRDGTTWKSRRQRRERVGQLERKDIREEGESDHGQFYNLTLNFVCDTQHCNSL